MKETAKMELMKWIGMCDGAYPENVGTRIYVDPDCLTCGSPQHLHYQPTFDTDIDIRLLAGKMKERCVLPEFGEFMCTYFPFFAMIENWVDLPPAEQATNIHSFLKEAGEIK